MLYCTFKTNFWPNFPRLMYHPYLKRSCITVLYACFSLLLFSRTGLAQAPVIAAFSPASGPVGSTIVISGSNFSTTSANNIVYFGGVRAAVTASSANSISVTVPDGATPQPITVTTNGLTAYSSRPFVATFPGGSAYFMSSSFTGSVAGPTGLYPKIICIADFDGDGKPDLATAGSANYPTSTVSVMRNTGGSGNMSFSTNMDLPVATNGNAYYLATGDIDGDGKLDLILTSIVTNTLSVYRNTSTVGAISFGARIDFATNRDPYGLAVGDLDGDGKPEIAVANFFDNSVSVFSNNSSPGIVSLATGTTMTTGLAPHSVSIGDLDGDGKPDLAVANTLSYSVALFRNLSSPGTLSFSARTDIVTGTDEPYSIKLADLDGDGKMDLAVNNDNFNLTTPATVSCSLFKNNSSPGTFLFGPAGNYGAGNVFELSIGDLNGDGRPDLVSPAATSGLIVYPNTGSPGSISFGNPGLYKMYAPFAAAMGDLDGDGVPDLVVANTLNNGFSTFKNTSNLAGISRFFPLIAPAGSPVLITGANLSGATGVQFGGTPAASFTVLSDSAVNATVAAGSSGDVTVMTPKGVAALSGFTFAGVPTISSFTPANAGEGATVTINGTYLLGTSSVTFGGSAARSFQVNSATSLTAVVDTGFSGNIVLTTPGGTATAGAFSYTGPVVARFSPVAGNSGTVVTITGTNIALADTVTFGGIPATSIKVLTDTTIQAVVGAGASGNLRVVTYKGSSSKAGFSFTGPTISSYSPAFGGAGTVITLTGTNFTGASTVTIGGTPAAYFTFVDSSTIRAVAGIGTNGSIQVVTPMGVASSSSFIYTKFPVITGFSPTSGPVGSNITITGANFSTDPAANIVYFGSVRAQVTAANVNQLKATVPTGTNNAPVTVTTNGLTAYANLPFTVTFDGAGPAFTASSFDGRLDFPADKGPAAIVITDLDGDGKPELIAGSDSSGVSVLRNTSTTGFPSFAPRLKISTTYRPRYLAAGDVDGDGRPDLVIADNMFGPSLLSVYLNTSSRGSVSFAPKTDIANGGSQLVQLRDLDGDGKPDMVVINSYPNFNFSVSLNTSSGGTVSFGPPAYYNTFSGGASQMAIADLNTDGRPDIVMLNGNYASIFRNASTPGFIIFQHDMDISIAGSNVLGLTAGDIDGDGMPDLAFADAGAGNDNLYLYRNTYSAGKISFGPGTVLSATTDYEPAQLTINDMDGDGKPDLVVTNINGPTVSVYRGNSSPGMFSFAPAIDYPIGRFGNETQTGDLDGDGRPEIISDNSTLNTLSVLHNRLGSPTAPSVLVNGSPVICQGDSVLLTASVVTGDQWYKDGQPISEAKSRNLTVYDAGNYTVTTTIDGTVSPASTAISISAKSSPDKPVITLDAVNGLVSSAADSNQWFIDTLSGIPGAIANSYKPSDSGYYSLRVSNNGCTSPFANRYFYHLPKVPDTSGNAPGTPPARVSPNPVTNGQVTIYYNFPGITSLNLLLSDFNGKPILMQTNVHSGDTVNLSAVSNGIYSLTLLDSSGKIYSTVRIVKL